MGNYVNLPAGIDDLETEFTSQQYLDVLEDDGTRVGQAATSEYAIKQFKDYISAGNATFNWNGQSDYAPSSSPVVLQIWNYDTTEWENLATNDTVNADTDFTLSSAVADLTNYKSNNITVCRVYQLGP
jgi:hypothetical protein